MPRLGRALAVALVVSSNVSKALAADAPAPATGLAPIAPAPAAPAAWGPPPAYGYPVPYPAYAPPTLPIQMRHIEGKPVPDGYHVETRVRKGLVIGGAITFGTFYFISASIGAASESSEDRWLYLPVLGPFADAEARRGRGCSSASSTASDCLNQSARGLLVFDGLSQVTGAALLLAAYLTRYDVLVRDDAPISRRAPEAPSWAVAPTMVARDAPGLAFASTF